jgi:lipopolysaccharide export system protein LptA
MKHAAMIALLACAIPATAMLSPGLAQGALLGKLDTDKDISIEADKNEYDDKAKTVSYSGNVKATQGAIYMRSDSMKYDTPNNKIHINGKVVVTSPASGTITGNNAIYDMTRKLVTLSGNVVLNKPGQMTMTGSLLTVNMVTGKAELGGGAVAGTTNQAAAPAAPGGRVRGVFTPKSGGQ